LDEESEINAELDYKAISIYDRNNEFQDRYANLNKVLNFKNSKIKASLPSVYYALF